MEQFDELVRVMERLRAPGGCPWDREQTHHTLRPYLLEESYEALEAIDQQDWDCLRDELGDVLLQVVFHARLASERGDFDIADTSTPPDGGLSGRGGAFVQGRAAGIPVDELVMYWDVTVIGWVSCWRSAT